MAVHTLNAFVKGFAMKDTLETIFAILVAFVLFSAALLIALSLTIVVPK
jgi:hypothetical protein